MALDVPSPCQGLRQKLCNCQPRVDVRTSLLAWHTFNVFLHPFETFSLIAKAYTST